MSKEKKSVPELRFPEFVNDGKWEEDFLGNRGDFIGGGTPSKKNKYWQGHIPWVSSSDISEDSIHHIDKTRFITKDAVKKSATKIIPKNSLLIVSRVGVGKVGITKEKICTSQDFTNFTPSKDDVFFLGYYLKSCKDVLLRFSQGMAIKGFTKDDISNLNLPFPDNTQEQQKIAACLSSLDELITTHNDKLEVLKDHKKGLLQNLFPHKGEKVTKVRFPEFEEDGEWVEKTLGSLVKIKSGYSPSKYNLEDTAKHPFVKVEDLNNCEKYQIISRKYSDDTDNLIPIDSVIFPKRGAAINLNKVRLNQVEILMDTNLMAITPNIHIEAEFLYYVVLNIGLHRIADTSTIPQINNKHIKPFEILIPKKDEQKKIAACLSALDELIIAQTEKIEQLQQHKKGLMQGLFPKIDN